MTKAQAMITKQQMLTSSASQLASWLKEGRISSRELLETHIEEIRRVNPVINAVVENRFELARQEALAADRRLRDEEPSSLPPLLGVPCTIKESFALQGMPNTSGLMERRGIRAKEDAITVARVRKAGAIPMGVTNTSELCMWMESNNRVYGRSNNPYDARRIVGGSSGGEGAIVGSGASPFGLGSDIGGSIRMPAFFNGVFGHKPTGGLVPCSGQFPVPHGEACSYVATGPLCRRAEDLMPLLRIMAGPDGEDPACKVMEIGDVSKVNIADLKVVSIESNGRVAVSEDLRDAQRKVFRHLERKGAEVSDVMLADLQKSFEIWSSMLSAAGGDSFAQLLKQYKPFRPVPEFLRWVVGNSPHTLPALILAVAEEVPKYLPSEADRYLALGQRLREDFAVLLGNNGVLLYPSYASPAPMHYKPMFPPFNWIYTAILNVMKFPVTQVPLGLNAEGIPLGVQVAALPGNDHLTIAVALELEKAFGGWVPPPPRLGISPRTTITWAINI
jgi:fatty acid amide hydrolase 2